MFFEDPGGRKSIKNRLRTELRKRRPTTIQNFPQKIANLAPQVEGQVGSKSLQDAIQDHLHRSAEKGIKKGDAAPRRSR